MSVSERKDYDVLLKEHPEFEGVITRKNWEFVGHSDKGTVGFLKKLWAKNIRENVKNNIWKKSRGLHDDCIGIGSNKAVVGIGAGQCFNKNKDLLRQMVAVDGTKSWKDRNFIFIASNHQFKPLLKMGIIPDFVTIADASDVVLDQLTKDIPAEGQNCVLIAGLHCSPKVLKRWRKQGRIIRFYLPHTTGLDDVFKEETGEDPKPHIILQGGNVLNSAWSIGLKYFHSTVFFALGNDLSYPVKDTIEDQRVSYYADGDYSSNAKETGTGRDEASASKRWMGYSLEPRKIYTGKLHESYDIKLDVVGTTYTLWVYKTWLESNILGNEKSGKAYHYYNCTEGGIAGVMCKDDSDEGLNDPDNWFLMDDVCKRWHTTTLKDAAERFIRAKETMKCGLDVRNATDMVLPASMGIVEPVRQSLIL